MVINICNCILQNLWMLSLLNVMSLMLTSDLFMAWYMSTEGWSQMFQEMSCARATSNMHDVHVRSQTTSKSGQYLNIGTETLFCVYRLCGIGNVSVVMRKLVWHFLNLHIDLPTKSGRMSVNIICRDCIGNKICFNSLCIVSNV